MDQHRASDDGMPETSAVAAPHGRVEAGGEWPPIDVIFQGGTIRLVQDHGCRHGVDCVWFTCDQSHDIIGAIAREGGYEAQTAEISRLRRELRAQRKGMGDEIERLAEENDRLRERLSAGVRGKVVASGHLLNRRDWALGFEVKVEDQTFLANIERFGDYVIVIPAEPGPDGEGSDTD
jgi:hypothetical protein